MSGFELQEQTEKDELVIAKSNANYWFMKHDKLEKELAALKEENRKLREALEEILSTVSIDWYTQHFGKDETPKGVSSGIASVIHNRETLERIKIAFSNAQQALADSSQGSGEEK